MIRLRVEWRHTCPSCGTQLVVDYVLDDGCRELCPWCGHGEKTPLSPGEDEVRQYVTSAVLGVENDVNEKLRSRR